MEGEKEKVEYIDTAQSEIDIGLMWWSKRKDKALILFILKRIHYHISLVPKCPHCFITLSYFKSQNLILILILILYIYLKMKKDVLLFSIFYL